MKKIIIFCFLILAVLVLVFLVKRVIWKNQPSAGFPGINTVLPISKKTTINKNEEGAWITTTPNKRYFMFEDGRPFLPLGVAVSGDHLNFDYFGKVSIGGKSLTFNDNTIEDLFKRIQASGGNYLRVDIEGLSALPISDTKRLISEKKIGMLEFPVGVFDESYAKKIDKVFALAQKYNIYIDLVLIAHTCELTVFDGWQERFNLYSYSKAQGGPAADFDEFFKSTKAKDLYKKRLDYIVDRWGQSSNLFVLELFNEVLNCGGTDPVAAATWTAEMGNYLRDYQIKKYGKAHLIAISTDDFVPEHEFFYSSSGVDIFVNHLYGDISATAGNPVALALNINRELPKMLNKISYSRPHLENERTLFWKYPVSVQEEAEKYTAWSEFISGSAGTGATWIRVDPYGLFRSDEIVNHSNGAIGKIVKNFDFVNFNSRPITLKSSNSELIPMAVKDNNQAIVWVLHNNPLDYDLDIINLLRQDKITDTKIKLATYHEWIKLYKNKGINIFSGEYLNTLTESASKALNLPKDQASKLITDFINDPTSIKGSGLSTSPNMLKQLNTFIVSLDQQLEKVESNQKILSGMYRGHPQMTSNITVSLDPGTYIFKWYDDNTGKLLKEEKLESKNGTIVFSTPQFRKTIALTIQPI